jgi:hypothetical protein
MSVGLSLRKLEMQKELLAKNVEAKIIIDLITDQYQGKKCKTRTTLRFRTVMQVSNLPFRTWVIDIHLIKNTKNTFSALELQTQIVHKFYELI